MYTRGLKLTDLFGLSGGRGSAYLSRLLGEGKESKESGVLGTKNAPQAYAFHPTQKLAFFTRWICLEEELGILGVMHEIPMEI